jgi:phosphatidate cytidylyltransferase
MGARAGRFPDLAPRIVSSAVIAAAALAALWAGGLVFLVTVAAIAALMVWELARMLDLPARAPQAALLAGAGAGAVIAAGLLPLPWGLLPPVLPGLAGISLLRRNGALFALGATLIALAAFGFHYQRAGYGVVWTLWLAAVVIVTDVGGYFAGRLIGGAKLWPRVSPNKTWAGTLAGWAAAALVGGAFLILTGAGAGLIAVSVLMSMAAQAGDIAESAVKRRMGVKDASALIPGHGGMMDRFDGMLGASVLLLLVEAVSDFPPGIEG